MAGENGNSGQPDAPEAAPAATPEAAPVATPEAPASATADDAVREIQTVTITRKSILKGQKCKVVGVLEDGRLSVEVLADVTDAEGNVVIAKGELTTVSPDGCE